MSDDPYRAFIAGERPDDVCVFISATAPDRGVDFPVEGIPVNGGTVYVIEGERGQTLFSMATGEDIMTLARHAMRNEGAIGPNLTAGTCPVCGRTGHPLALFAFAEEQNEAVGGLYAEGNVVHAYAMCSCGESYSDRWVAD